MGRDGLLLPWGVSLVTSDWAQNISVLFWNVEGLRPTSTVLLAVRSSWDGWRWKSRMFWEWLRLSPLQNLEDGRKIQRCGGPRAQPKRGEGVKKSTGPLNLHNELHRSASWGTRLQQRTGRIQWQGACLLSARNWVWSPTSHEIQSEGTRFNHSPLEVEAGEF